MKVSRRKVPGNRLQDAKRFLLRTPLRKSSACREGRKEGACKGGI